MLMMKPPPRRCRCGSAAWQALNTPVRFVSITSDHCSGVIAATSAKMPTPALLIRMSRPPKRATVASTTRRHVVVAAHVGLQRLDGARARRPRSRGRAADRCASLRPVTVTFTPSATSARAIARPMPREPPVTIATCLQSLHAPCLD